MCVKYVKLSSQGATTIHGDGTGAKKNSNKFQIYSEDPSKGSSERSHSLPQSRQESHGKMGLLVSQSERSHLIPYSGKNVPKGKSDFLQQEMTSKVGWV